MKKVSKAADPPGIFERISLIRYNDDNASNEQLMTLSKEKKKFNIPIGDVTIDDDYEKNVTASFALPTSYVRYIKRIGLEDDPTVDYNVEDEDLKWIRSHPSLSVDKDCIKYLTVESFETIFNTFERSTGYSTTVVPQFTAKDIITKKLKWNTTVIDKIIPDLYQYWLSKRNKLNKPLCRKFWPPTLTTDTNPHHVFRPRDKERYRLRKQQRKNDLESFRKMQTLRYEFMRAKNLMQLVLERELLKEAELKIQQEIFEQTIHDYSNNNTTRTTAPFQHKLLFPHLLKEPEKEQKVVSQDTFKLKLVLSKSDFAPPVADPPIRTRKPKKKREVVVAASSDDVLGDAVNAETDAQVVIAEEKKETVMMYETLPGPKYVCRSQWPNFMSNLPTRSKLNVQMNLSDYIDELDMRPNEVPRKFMSKARVGRGGRLVVDRIPVYDKPREDWDPIHSSYSFSRHSLDQTYIYPTMISNDINTSDLSAPPPQLSSRSSPMLEISSNLQSKVPFYAYSKSRFLPSAYPPVYSSFTATLAAREREIYNCSDSEDERVELFDIAKIKLSSDIKYIMKR